MNTDVINKASSLIPEPLFSVVIATYNYGHLIERAIDSVLNQTCQDFEIIVVDDGSTDDTAARIARFADRVRYIHKSNGGQSSAYNLGAAAARGRYICILDADDEYTPEALTHFASVAPGRDPGPHLLYGGYISVSASGQEHTRQPSPSPNTAKARFLAFLRKKIKGIQNCTTAISRETFSKITFPESLRRNTDVVFYAQVLANFPAIRTNAIIAKIHEHPQRVRKIPESVLQTGLTPVNALFDPDLIPADLMRYKHVFAAQRMRSMARMHFNAAEYTIARDLYWRALREYPPTMLALSSINRFLLSLVRAR